MRNNIFRLALCNLLALNSYAGNFNELDAWNARNNRDFMNALRYMLHTAIPRYVAAPEPVASILSDESSQTPNLHFNHESKVEARFASHFIGTRPMGLDILNFYFKYPERFNGLDKPHGLLLYGPPGTGKTTIARILAGESGLDFISLSGSDFSQKYYGDGSKAVHALFKFARDLKKQVILFIDEIDSVGVKRTEESNQEDRKVLNTLLEELTNQQNDNVFVVGATNHVDLLDKAFQRRFNYKEKIDVPDEGQRKKIFIFYLDGKKHGLDCKKCFKLDCNCPDNPLKRIMEKMKTNGCSGPKKPFSGSDIKEFVNLAAVLARIPGSETICEEHFNIAYTNIQEKNRVDWTIGEAVYRGIMRSPLIGDSLNFLYNLRNPDKEQ